MMEAARDINIGIDHPLTQMACRLLQNVAGEWTYDDQAVEIIETGLLALADHPSVAEAVIGLTHLGVTLQAEHNALDAAGRLFAIVGRCGPALVVLAPVTEVAQSVLDAAKAAQRLTGAGAGKVDLLAETPEGAVKASELEEVRKARMRQAFMQPQRPRR